MTELEKHIRSQELTELQVTGGESASDTQGRCAGLTFVITGDLLQLRNRDEFKAYVDAQGGHVASSVSRKTAFLVNNDQNSASSKNQKAMELGIPILSKDEFIQRFENRGALWQNRIPTTDLQAENAM